MMILSSLFFFLVVKNAYAYPELSQALTNVWSGIVQTNQNRQPFLIHRPYSETPGDAVSEGVGYGMLMALFLNDQPTFNLLIEGAESTMWNGQFYDWRVDDHNLRTAYGAATDAEQDIAAALLLAQQRVEAGQWTVYPDDFYHQRAQTIMDNLWNQGITPRVRCVRGTDGGERIL